MRVFFSLIILSFISFGFQNSNNGFEDRMSSFKWLIGTWTTNTNEGKILETWLPMGDSIYSGQSTLYKKTTETVALESIQFIRRNKEYFFIPTVNRQNDNKPVEYKVIAMNKNSFTAENKAHDFPKKISYILFKKDSLHTVLEGGSGKRKDYYYGRVKKSTPSKPGK